VKPCGVSIVQPNRAHIHTLWMVIESPHFANKRYQDNPELHLPRMTQG